MSVRSGAPVPHAGWFVLTDAPGCGKTSLLHSEIARILREHVYDHRVFFVEELGFVQPTAAGRISLHSRAFARIHRDTCERAGFHLVDIPRADICTRVDLIQSHLAAWS